MKFVSNSKLHSQEVRPSGERIDPRSSDEPTSRSEFEKIVCQDVLQALRGLQFGEVTITVRDGRIIQIDRVTRDRQRFAKEA